MVRISDARLDYFMAEDVPYLDLTSEVLGIGDASGEMEYFSREACIVAGVGEVARLAEAALSDKKRRGNSITLVLPERIGQCRLETVAVSELPAWFARGTGEAPWM